MRCLYITHIWNEIDYLPLKAKWCRENGLEMYILDNMSDDGSWEWLKKNNIRSEQINTAGSFHLGTLQKKTDSVIKRIKPDWVIYLGMDSFALTENRLCDEIAKASAKGFNIIQMTWANLFNTGEPRDKFDPFNTYFRYSPIRQKIRLIWKYHSRARLLADEIIFPKFRKVHHQEGIILNYGNTKSAIQRRETYNRRRKAWKRGLTKGWGTHYPVYAKKNWIWDAEVLLDIRESEYFKYFQK